MKRRLFKLVVFLLLGAIVNVAVGWGCAYWSPFPRIGSNAPQTSSWANIAPLSAEARWLEERGWQLTRSEVPPTDRYLRRFYKSARFEIQQFSRSTFGLERIEYREWYAHLQRHDNQIGGIELPSRWPFLARTRAGWPLPALHGEQRAGLISSGRVLTWQYGTAVPCPTFGKPSASDAILPFRPLWPEFAINTIFYAAILWLPFAPFQLRRYVRVKRGHCIKCGYDLRGAEHGACPECGVELSPSDGAT